MDSTKKGVWVTNVKEPEKGFPAFMIELVFGSGGQYPLKVTTDIKIVSDVLPYEGDQ